MTDSVAEASPGTAPIISCSLSSPGISLAGRGGRIGRPGVPPAGPRARCSIRLTRRGPRPWSSMAGSHRGTSPLAAVMTADGQRSRSMSTIGMRLSSSGAGLSGAVPASAICALSDRPAAGAVSLPGAWPTRCRGPERPARKRCAAPRWHSPRRSYPRRAGTAGTNCATRPLVPSVATVGLTRGRAHEDDAHGRRPRRPPGPRRAVMKIREILSLLRVEMTQRHRSASGRERLCR